MLQQGFSRIEVDGEINLIELLLNEKLKQSPKKINIVIDRFINNQDEDMQSRIHDSVETAFYEGDGKCIIHYQSTGELLESRFSSKFEADGMEFELPIPHMFSFNNPVGACKKCEGFGQVIGIDKDLVIPNKNLVAVIPCE